MNNKAKSFYVIFLAAMSSPLLAAHDNHWYIAASAGIFQGLFNSQYNDQSDIISQNFRQQVMQNSYTGGLAIGYSNTCWHTYFWGGELGIYGSTYHANFATGAATAAFTDTLAIKSNLDLTFIPGFFITNSLAAYGKAGLSYARINASVNSPVGLNPTFIKVNNMNNVLGLALGLGLEKSICNNTSLFIEYNYHDYGTVNFSSFQNFTAIYSHSAHIYSQSLTIGAAFLI